MKDDVTGDGRMAKWGLLLNRPLGGGDGEELTVLATIEGTREEAEQQLGELVRGYHPKHPRRPVRKRVFRTVDGWLLMGDGSSGQVYNYRFLLCELEWDSGPLARAWTTART